jgi:hypothetical protein
MFYAISPRCFVQTTEHALPRQGFLSLGRGLLCAFDDGAVLVPADDVAGNVIFFSMPSATSSVRFVRL